MSLSKPRLQYYIVQNNSHLHPLPCQIWSTHFSFKHAIFKWGSNLYLNLKGLHLACHSYQSSYSHKIWVKSCFYQKIFFITPKHHWTLPFISFSLSLFICVYTFGTNCLSFKNFCSLFSQLNILFLFLSTFFCLPVFSHFFFIQQTLIDLFITVLGSRLTETTDTFHILLELSTYWEGEINDCQIQSDHRYFSGGINNY